MLVYCLFFDVGLFPVLGHAATNVKPSLLTIYETHFVPLRERLGPGLNGFLSGVLPGLEEGTDYYERWQRMSFFGCILLVPTLFIYTFTRHSLLFTRRYLFSYPNLFVYLPTSLLLHPPAYLPTFLSLSLSIKAGNAFSPQLETCFGSSVCFVLRFICIVFSNRSPST